MKIYTRGGDRGETSLFGGARVPKDDLRIEAYGTVDELSSFLGVVRAADPPAAVATEIALVQHDLFEIGAHLASPGTSRFTGVDPSRIEALERSIDTFEAALPPLTSFILPGGSTAAAHLHVARTVCRRAERRVVSLRAEDAASVSTVTYLNRLSDWLFVAARFANHEAGAAEVKWER